MRILFLLTILFVSLATVKLQNLESDAENGEGSRAIGYKKKKGTTTPRPTWRPWVGTKQVIPPGIITDDPNALFPDDYYDDYDQEIEGTRRNILMHRTFEERMKNFMELKIRQQNNVEKAVSAKKAGKTVRVKGSKGKRGDRGLGGQSKQIVSQPVVTRTLNVGSLF